MGDEAAPAAAGGGVDGADSDPESLMVTVCKSGDLPQSEGQERVRERGGSMRRVCDDDGCDGGGVPGVCVWVGCCSSRSRLLDEWNRDSFLRVWGLSYRRAGLSTDRCAGLLSPFCCCSGIIIINICYK